MNKNFQVIVSDNYHHGDESERYAVGTYASLEEAREKCEEVTAQSLKNLYERGITAEKLSAQWIMFGEDPYIVGGDGAVPFSARKWITTELCQAIIDSELRR